jgi:hypothetical protein
VGLASLRAPGRGVYASGGPLYRSAVFGRDALQVAEDLLPRNVALAREIVIKLAELQGEGNHAVTEEEPAESLMSTDGHRGTGIASLGSPPRFSASSVRSGAGPTTNSSTTGARTPHRCSCK